MVDRRPHSLYLHIPFCVSKCPYCDFNSHVGLEGLFESYCRALALEIRRWGDELGAPWLDTIFIGGGTPSRVPAAHIAVALGAVREAFDVAADAEITLEANPQSAEAVKMEAWLEAGVNRLSLGFQSLDLAALAFLERAHGAAEAVAVYRRARAAGFVNINCDLIFAVPGLSTERWAQVLGEVIALWPDHVSAYELTPEQGTRLGADVAAGSTLLPDDEVKIEQYEVTSAMLGAAGYGRYEVSNWARPGRECRHNLAYWSGVPYAAAGAGAHAYLQVPAVLSWLPAGIGRATGDHGEDGGGAVAVRQWNLSNPAAYIKALGARGRADAGHEWLDLPTTVGEFMMMGLRKELGIDLADLERRWGYSAAAAVGRTAAGLEGRGLVEAGGGTVRATAAGRRVLNQVAIAFLP